MWGYFCGVFVPGPEEIAFGFEEVGFEFVFPIFVVADDPFYFAGFHVHLVDLVEVVAGHDDRVVGGIVEDGVRVEPVFAGFNVCVFVGACVES